GELEKRSKLRQLCEGDGKTIGALACYAEEGPARQRIIAEMLEHLGTRASRNVLAFLGDILPPDRMAMRSEIEKLALYARGKPGIEMEDVLAVVHDAGAAEIDDLVYAAGAGNGMQVRQLLDRLFAEQVSAVAILRAAQRHFLRLQWARDQMEKGVGAAEAVKKLQPPVFWKHVEPMCAQVRRWPLMHIERILETLYEAEAAVKRTGASEAVQLSHILLGVTAGLVRRPNAAA
ncbi:MAG: DNA polymerase III subunit delta, partial [Bdellovibrionales bacterium]